MILCCALTETQLATKNERVEKLIKQLASGDVNCMGCLYELIRTDVYAFALSKSKNHSDAEDILQDTFIQIYKYAKQYKPQGKPLAWIFTIVSNLANRRFQLNQRTISIGEDEELICDGKQMEKRVLDNEFLRQLMNTLSQEEQEIIVLHVVSGMKHQEIADLLDKPLSTVLSRYNRAIRKLQNIEKEEAC